MKSLPLFDHRSPALATRSVVTGPGARVRHRMFGKAFLDDSGVQYLNESESWDCRCGLLWEMRPEPPSCSISIRSFYEGLAGRSGGRSSCRIVSRERTLNRIQERGMSKASTPSPVRRAFILIVALDLSVQPLSDSVPSW